MNIYVINLSTIKFDKKKRKTEWVATSITVRNWIENNPENLLLENLATNILP